MLGLQRPRRHPCRRSIVLPSRFHRRQTPSCRLLLQHYLLALLANFVFLILIKRADDSATRAAAAREETVLAVEKLRRETEMLRRLVRAYTATGQPNYLLTYYEIVGIHLGEKPQPVADDSIVFWEEVIADPKKHAISTTGPRSPLVDRMKALNLSAQELAVLARVMAATDQLSLSPPEVFRPQPQAPVIELRMAEVNQVFDEVLATLIETFQHAQASFWCGRDGDSDVSRLRWLEQVLKAALLNAIERMGLNEDEKNLLYGLVAEDNATPAVQGLQVSLQQQSVEHRLVSADLLVIAERDERRLVLWCQPSGTVRRFDDLAEFACALRDALADRYDFDTLSWACEPVNGCAFRYQASQLLNAALQNIERVQLYPIAQARELESLYSQLST